MQRCILFWEWLLVCPKKAQPSVTQNLVDKNIVNETLKLWNDGKKVIFINSELLKVKISISSNFYFFVLRSLSETFIDHVLSFRWNDYTSTDLRYCSPQNLVIFDWKVPVEITLTWSLTSFVQYNWTKCTL